MSDCPKMKDAVYVCPGVWEHPRAAVHRVSQRPVRWHVTTDPHNVFHATMYDAMAKLNGLPHEVIVQN